MKTSILIIDDDDKLNRLLQAFLAGFNMEVVSATKPSVGLKLLRDRRPDLVILDLMLPEMDGFAVCREIRRLSTVPIIMLTARGDLADRIVGLELGADDYLAKPFEPRELVARIQSVLRRCRQDLRPDTIAAGRVTIDRTARTVYLDNAAIDLSTNEYDLLALLVGRPGRVFSRDDILQEMRGTDCDAFNRTVDVTISRLRQKLGDDPRYPRLIKTVWGAGYAFMEGGGDASAIDE
ncbi:MAG: response regulator transcription factor [Desulfoprunum sp.]|nr:response regulator transcription factor [Desulfoprunum sp.]